MENTIQKIKKILELVGWVDARVLCDEEHRKISIFIDDESIKNQIPQVLTPLEHIFNLILHKENKLPHVVDLNYYRKERERLIAELARAAAKKAMLTKNEVSLPPMNAYERRLVHLEITSNPELSTESIGQGRERHIIIKHLN